MISAKALDILKFFSLILLSAVILIGCNTSNAFTKKGQELEAAGMKHEAANNYFIALQKNRTNIEAQIGMKSTGQTVLNDKLNEFVQKKSFGNKKEAVDAYHASESYYKKIKGVGIELTIPDYYAADYEEVKDDYLHDLYEEGTTLLEAEKFKEAENVFAKISALDPSFKDASSLGDIAYLEPLYSAGMDAMEIQHWRTAYDNLTKVIERQGTYKDASKMREDCLEAGRYTMAILEFKNATNSKGQSDRVQAYVLDALTGIDDPFLKIVDRDNLQTIMDEQQLGMSGIIDEETAVSVGELIGAKAIITGTVLSFNENKGRTTSKTLPAFEQYKQKKYNEAEGKYYNVTKYKKVNYKEYSCTNTASATFQYKVISLKTGEVILSKIVEKENSDQVRYATSDSEVGLIYPSKNNAVSQNRNARNELQALFHARQTPKSTNDLANELYGIVSNQMKGDISELIKETVK